MHNVSVPEILQKHLSAGAISNQARCDSPRFFDFTSHVFAADNRARVSHSWKSGTILVGIYTALSMAIYMIIE